MGSRAFSGFDNAAETKLWASQARAGGQKIRPVLTPVALRRCTRCSTAALRGELRAQSASFSRRRALVRRRRRATFGPNIYGHRGAH